MTPTLNRETTAIMTARSAITTAHSVETTTRLAETATTTRSEETTIVVETTEDLTTIKTPVHSGITATAVVVSTTTRTATTATATTTTAAVSVPLWYVDTLTELSHARTHSNESSEFSRRSWKYCEQGRKCAFRFRL